MVLCHARMQSLQYCTFAYCTPDRLSPEGAVFGNPAGSFMRSKASGVLSPAHWIPNHLIYSFRLELLLQPPIVFLPQNDQAHFILSETPPLGASDRCLDLGGVVIGGVGGHHRLMKILRFANHVVGSFFNATSKKRYCGFSIREPCCGVFLQRDQ